MEPADVPRARSALTGPRSFALSRTKPAGPTVRASDEVPRVCQNARRKKSPEEARARSSPNSSERW